MPPKRLGSPESFVRLVLLAEEVNRQVGKQHSRNFDAERPV
jgi:hypothetical protein